MNIRPKKQVAMTRIGLIGCGIWGRNLARNLAALGVLAGVATGTLTAPEILPANSAPAMFLSTSCLPDMILTAW